MFSLCYSYLYENKYYDYNDSNYHFTIIIQFTKK